MIVVNTDYITGKNIETLGVVFGTCVQAKDVVKDIGASLKNFFGGSIQSYEKMIDDASELAIAKIKENAKSMGADAVVNLRFVSPSTMDGAAEVMAYGTAVKFI